MSVSASRPASHLPRLRLVSAAISLVLSSAAFPLLAADTLTPIAADAAADAGPQATRLPTVEVQGDGKIEASSPKYTAPLLDTPQTDHRRSPRSHRGAEPAVAARHPQHPARHHLRRRRRRRRLRRQHQPARLQRQQRHHRRRRARQRAVHAAPTPSTSNRSKSSTARTRSTPAPARSAAPSTWSARPRAKATSHGLTLGAGTDGYGRVTARQQPRVRRRHRRAPERHGPPERRARAAMSSSSSAGASRRRSPSAWARTPRLTLELPAPGRRQHPAVRRAVFSANGGPLPGVDPSNYYGYHNVDTQEIDVDAFTGDPVEHDFSDALSVRNLTRCQRKSTRCPIVDAVQGTWCLRETGLNAAPAPPAARRPRHATSPAARAATCATPPTRPWINQTDLTARFRHRRHRPRPGRRRLVLARDLPTSTPAACSAMPTARRRASCCR